MPLDPNEPVAASRRRTVDRRMIDRLAERGLISPAARCFAIDLVEPPRRWGLWASRLLTIVGAALVLAGLVYFFAFNWNHIPPMAKLGSIATLLAIAFTTVAAVGFHRLVGEVAGSAAVVLVGVFLAVEGQIHQTGADAWQLFAGWAALTVAWALLAGSAATWCIWITVADLAVITWSQQVLHDDPRGSIMHLGLLLIDGAFLLAREYLVATGRTWPAGRWTRIVLVLPILAVLVLAAFRLWDRGTSLVAVDWVVLMSIPVALGTLLVVYARRLADVTVLSATAVATCVVIDIQLFQVFTDQGRHVDFGIFFVLGLVTLGMFAAAVAGVRSAARAMEA